MFDSTNTFDLLLVALNLLFAALMAGFFFAWSCAIMFGLDKTDDKTAIRAMNAINGAVRNPLFISPFLLTPILLIVNGLKHSQTPKSTGADLFFLSAFFYIFGVTLVTILISEPLNFQLAETSATHSDQTYHLIWQSYSKKWQRWNVIRTIFSSLAFVSALIAARALFK